MTRYTVTRSFNSSTTEMGAGYAYVADSAHGNYYTVDFGRQ